MALARNQRRVVKVSLRTANRLGASKKVKKALLEAEGVESNFTNVNHGDRDSLGVLQQRPSQGWGSPAQVRDVPHAVRSFVTRAQAIQHQYKRAGDLAQAVQRSAFPGRYQQLAGTAEQLLHGHLNTSGGARTVPGVDRSQDRRKLLATYLLNQNGIGIQGGDPLDPTSAAATSGTDLTSTLLKIARTRDTPAKRVKVGGKTNVSGKGVTRFDGKPVAKWIARELRYARAHGWKGSVNSGYRSFAEQKRIYNSGVRPAAKPGTSNHEGTQFPRGAVDVSDAAQLSQILRRKGSKLKWAGSKDPVHFSAPHGGSY